MIGRYAIIIIIIINNIITVAVVALCFVRVPFIALCYFCLYIVLLLLPATALLTHNVNKQEFN
jgi:hypothetical protein